MMAVTLPEPVRLRETSAQEDKKLSDFQAELVQLAACLRGDHNKETYPHKLVENMTVKEAVGYVEEAFKIFLNEGDKARKREADESSVVVVDAQPATPTRRSFAHMFFSCLACNN